MSDCTESGAGTFEDETEVQVAIPRFRNSFRPLPALNETIIRSKHCYVEVGTLSSNDGESVCRVFSADCLSVAEREFGGLRSSPAGFDLLNESYDLLRVVECNLRVEVVISGSTSLGTVSRSYGYPSFEGQGLAVVASYADSGPVLVAPRSRFSVSTSAFDVLRPEFERLPVYETDSHLPFVWFSFEPVDVTTPTAYTYVAVVNYFVDWRLRHF